MRQWHDASRSQLGPSLLQLGAARWLSRLASRSRHPERRWRDCKGTVTETMMGEEKIPEPISTGIILNVTSQTVQGFGTPVNIIAWVCGGRSVMSVTSSSGSQRTTSPQKRPSLVAIDA